MRKNPLDVIKNLIAERYSEAKAVFWAGSVAKGQGNNASDLDLIIIYEALPNAYREAFIYEEWPIDAFIHDKETLQYFFEKIDAPSHMLTLPYMILDGIEIPQSTVFGNDLKIFAGNIIQKGPNISQSFLDTKRFKITDLLDDLKNVKNDHEFITIAYNLHEILCSFYLLANKQWIGTGKALIRILYQYNPEISEEIFSTFHEALQTLSYIKIESVIIKILTPFGGLLWDGFKLEAPKEWRLEK